MLEKDEGPRGNWLPIMDGEEYEDQRRQESVRLYFEFFKHLATLGTVAAAATLAIYREGVTHRALLAYSLVMFGLGMLSALVGMARMLSRFSAGAAVGGASTLLAYLIVVLIGGGLLLVIKETLNFPDWMKPALMLMLLVLVVFLVYARHRRRTSTR